MLYNICCCSVAKSCLTLCDPISQTAWLQHARLPCPSPFPGVYSDSCPSSWWCHTVSSSVAPYFSCLQSFPASGYFLMSQLFSSGSQSIQCFSFSISPSNEYLGLISLGLIGLILQFKGLSRIFKSISFFGAWPSLWSSSHYTKLFITKNYTLKLYWKWVC